MRRREGVKSELRFDAGHTFGQHANRILVAALGLVDRGFVIGSLPDFPGRVFLPQDIGFGCEMFHLPLNFRHAHFSGSSGFISTSC